MKDKGAMVGLVIGIIVSVLFLGAGYKGYLYVKDKIDEGATIGDSNRKDEDGKSDDEIAEETFISTMTLLDNDAITFDLVGDDDFVEEEMMPISDVSMEVSISDIQPQQGPVGTIIAINGTNLSAKNIVNVTFGTEEVPIYNIRDNSIQCVATNILVPGNDYDIRVVYEDESISAGVFSLEALDKTILLEASITDTAIWNNFASELVNIYIPPNVVETTSLVTIEKINAQMGQNFHETIQDGDYYDIRIGDQHEFDGVISIELPLPEGYDSEENTPLVLYFDEIKGTWDPMVSEVTDKGTLAIRTDHLTNVAVYWVYNSVLSSDGVFRVYYDKYDTGVSGPTFTTSKELAIEIAEILAAARNAYNSELETKYQLPVATFATYKTAYPAVVHSGYSTTGGVYSAATGVIHLPGNYKSYVDLQTTPAHELFHMYQNQVINSFRMEKNLWLTEATAEYASYRLAYGLNPHIWPGSKSMPTNGLFTTNNFHEYTGAAFLDYAFTKTGSKFNDLMKEFVENSDTTYPEGILDSVFLGKTGDIALTSTAQLYRAFWLEAITDNNPQWCVQPGILISKAYGVRATPRVIKHTYKYTGAYIQRLVTYSALGMMDNVPKRIVKVTSADNTLSNVKGIVVNGSINYIKAANLLDLLNSQLQAFMKDNQNSWQWIQAASGSTSYSLFELEADNTLLIAMQPVGSNKASVEIREVTAVAQTKEFKEVKMNEEVEIIYGFDGIFEESTSLIVETDFGDGKVIKEPYENMTTINIKAKHLYENANASSITGNLYDVTGGKKELISSIVIPISFDQGLILTASNYSPKVGEEVVFSVNLKKDSYKYEWDLGVDVEISNNVTRVSHVYTEAGNYSPYVNVTDANGVAIGTGICDIEVEEIIEEDILGGWNLVDVTYDAAGKDDEAVFGPNSVIVRGYIYVNHTSFPDHIAGGELVSVTIELSATQDVYSIGAVGDCKIGEGGDYRMDGSQGDLLWIGKGVELEGVERANTGSFSKTIPKGEFEGDTLVLSVGIDRGMHRYNYVWHEE